MQKKERVEPLRTEHEIQDFLFCLCRSRNSERDVFLFKLGINTGLRMSDIVSLKVSDLTFRNWNYSFFYGSKSFY